jgi:hypothetical protein
VRAAFSEFFVWTFLVRDASLKALGLGDCPETVQTSQPPLFSVDTRQRHVTTVMYRLESDGIGSKVVLNQHGKLGWLAEPLVVGLRKFLHSMIEQLAGLRPN